MACHKWVLAVQNLEGRLEAFILSCYMCVHGKLSDACLCAVVYIACKLNVFWMCFSGYYIQCCSSLNIMQLATLFMMYKHEDLKSMMIATLEVKERSDCHSLSYTHSYTKHYMHWLYRY